MLQKIILLFTLLAMVLTSAILVYILIGAFAIPMPQFANGILFIIEFGACLLLIVALSSERWHFVVPFIAAEVSKHLFIITLRSLARLFIWAMQLFWLFFIYLRVAIVWEKIIYRCDKEQQWLKIFAYIFIYRFISGNISCDFATHLPRHL